jgi:8-oxo-dGTP pyrophosphatase MutT (NUDIX family)
MEILPLDMDSVWCAGLWRRANQAPLSPRLPLYAGPTLIGSVATALMDRLGANPARLKQLDLCFKDDQLGARWCLGGPITPALERLYEALASAGLVRTRHDEMLDVLDPAGRSIGAVERGVMRLLGMPVRCVHLVGVVDGWGTWVQQRSMHKAEAPGQWDTLVGGTVGFGEAPEACLQRELWEEAGLQAFHLRALQARGLLRVAHPTEGEDGLSYSVDHIDCFAASLAADVEPINRDGEVIRFELLSPQALADRLAREHFTLEAACVFLQVQGFTAS